MNFKYTSALRQIKIKIKTKVIAGIKKESYIRPRIVANSQYPISGNEIINWT
ncbi:hypothetical protein [Pedobacter sp. ok626]|uniref:hypothetical protein n=1 Tax=Pedobacter sp. ok626 TaxID=1761882 RepID=UPI0014047467|nr:hypothetical protein [Pedobacter sp. ok626]